MGDSELELEAYALTLPRPRRYLLLMLVAPFRVHRFMTFGCLAVAVAAPVGLGLIKWRYPEVDFGWQVVVAPAIFGAFPWLLAAMQAVEQYWRDWAGQTLRGQRERRRRYRRCFKPVASLARAVLFSMLVVVCLLTTGMVLAVVLNDWSVAFALGVGLSMMFITIPLAWVVFIRFALRRLTRTRGRLKALRYTMRLCEADHGRRLPPWLMRLYGLRHDEPLPDK